MLKIKNRLKLSWKSLLIGCLILLVVGGGIYYLVKQPDNKSHRPASGKTNLEPATKEDKQRADDNKKQIVQQEAQNSPSSNPDSKKIVQPVITYAGQYGDSVEVGGNVGGIFEDGGTCTAVFTKDGIVITKTSTGFKNVNSVNCPTITANSTEFRPKGQWSVNLKYTSSTASGTSTSRDINIK
jgi:hypothetical protein